MKLIFDYKFSFYTSKMNFYWLYFSSIIMSFGQGVSDNNRMFTQIFFGATGKKMHMPMLSFLGEIFPTSFMLLI